MSEPNWMVERNYLRGLVKTGEITSAPRDKLEWYLIVLANHHNMRDDLQETEQFTHIICELLQTRLTTELAQKAAESSSIHNQRSRKIAIIALVISGISV